MMIRMKPWNKVRTLVTGSLPNAYLSGLPDIRITGMQEISIGPHRGLMAYSEERILLRTADRVLCVSGRGLTVSNMTVREIHIRGSISGVESAEL